MKKILGIETSQTACSVAILQGEDIISHHEIAPRQQAKTVLSVVDKTLTQANLSLNELDAIAFGSGPGSFTGLRIAAGVAQGLAYSASLPVIPVSSLQVVAQSVYESTRIPHVVVAIDARLDEVYWGAYTLDEDSGLMKGEDNVSPPKCVLLPEVPDFALVGDGWTVYEGLMPAGEPSFKKDTVDADAAVLAKIASSQEGAVPASLGIPRYVRDKVAIDSTGQ